MKALTLTQPWATLVAIGAKRIETRSWRTSYRGPLAIHAAKGFPRWAREFSLEQIVYEAVRPALEEKAARGDHVAFPLGRVIATCRLVACTLTSLAFEERLSENERAFGDYAPGRFAWILEDVKMLPEPIPAKGALSLWEWESAALSDQHGAKAEEVDQQKRKE